MVIDNENFAVKVFFSFKSFADVKQIDFNSFASEIKKKIQLRFYEKKIEIFLSLHRQ